MLVVKGNDITLSYRDNLDITFRIDGFEIKSSDIITFSVKKDIDSEDIQVEKTFTGIEGTDFNVILDKNEVSKLPLGVYYYDLFLENDNERITLIQPSKLTIVKIVHNS